MSPRARSFHAMNRRTFLGAATTVTAGTLLGSRLGWAADEHRIEKVGVQLYTVRDQMKADFEGTLAKVASIGYKEVEFAGYFGRTPQQVRALLEKNGLRSPSCHVDYDQLTPEKWPAQIESAKIVGQHYIVNPWIPEELRKTQDDWKRAAHTFNRAGDEAQKAGLQFAYHNHWFEFLPLEGKLPYDMLLEQCDKELVKMELDLCWITVGGGDPIKYFNRYPGRFPLVHVKDVKRVPPVTAAGSQDFGSSMNDMTEVGSGIIDWKKIFAQSELAGIRHYIVEHDHPKEPFESIRTSYEYLNKLRW
jgi:sugar phosphate isomerase/epimerase